MSTISNMKARPSRPEFSPGFSSFFIPRKALSCLIVGLCCMIYGCVETDVSIGPEPSRVIQDYKADLNRTREELSIAAKSIESKISLLKQPPSTKGLLASEGVSYSQRGEIESLEAELAYQSAHVKEIDEKILRAAYKKCEVVAQESAGQESQEVLCQISFPGFSENSMDFEMTVNNIYKSERIDKILYARQNSIWEVRSIYKNAN